MIVSLQFSERLRCIGQLRIAAAQTIRTTPSKYSNACSSCSYLRYNTVGASVYNGRIYGLQTLRPLGTSTGSDREMVFGVLLIGYCLRNCNCSVNMMWRPVREEGSKCDRQADKRERGRHTWLVSLGSYTFSRLTSMLGIHSLDLLRGRKGGISAILGGEALTNGLWLTGECIVECACLRKGGISGICIGGEDTLGLIVSLKFSTEEGSPRLNDSTCN